MHSLLHPARQVSGRLFSDVPAQSLRRSSRLSGQRAAVEVREFSQEVCLVLGAVSKSVSQTAQATPTPGTRAGKQQLSFAVDRTVDAASLQGEDVMLRSWCGTAPGSFISVALAWRSMFAVRGPHWSRCTPCVTREGSGKTAEGGREALALLQILADGYRARCTYRCQVRMLRPIEQISRVMRCLFFDRVWPCRMLWLHLRACLQHSTTLAGCCARSGARMPRLWTMHLRSAHLQRLGRCVRTSWKAWSTTAPCCGT